MGNHLRKLEEGEFRIAEYRIPELDAKFDKVNKRAAKLGLLSIVYLVVETEVIQVTKFDGVNHTPTGEVKTYQIITVQGEAPKLAGWSFAATLEHHVQDDGTSLNLLRKVPTFLLDLPLIFRERGPEHCDHCQTIRRRNDTFVVFNEETKEFKQVGRSCLRDFLGHASPEAIARYCEMLVSLDLGNMDVWGEGSGGGRWEPQFMHEGVIARTLALINKDGWMSRGQARDSGDTATADSVWFWLNPPTQGEALRVWEKAFGDLEVTDADREKAKLIVEWSEALGEDDPSTLGDYLFNLRQSFKLAAVGARQIGIVASAVFAYERAMAKEAKRRQFDKAGQTSQHFGAVKDRPTLTLTVLSVFANDGVWGTTHIHKMLTEDGNMVTWFSSSDRLDVGSKYTGKATIKDHKEYKGTKETVVTRCKFTKVEGE